MRIINIKTKKDLKRFINMQDNLYKNDKLAV